MTHQTGPEGKMVNKILITEALDIEKEYYFAITFDRSKNSDVFIVSSEGGVDIEEVAENNPDDLIKLYISPSEGLNTEVVNKAIKDSKLNKDFNDELNNIILKLYNLFVESDCDLVEVNPLAITNKGVSALDSKISLDMNAVYRHDNFLDIETVSYTHLTLPTTPYV